MSTLKIKCCQWKLNYVLPFVFSATIRERPFQHYPSYFLTAVARKSTVENKNPLWKTRNNGGKQEITAKKFSVAENNFPPLFSATSGGKQCGK